jgi:hypothetical protein
LVAVAHQTRLGVILQHFLLHQLVVVVVVVLTLLVLAVLVVAVGLSLPQHLVLEHLDKVIMAEQTRLVAHIGQVVVAVLGLLARMGLTKQRQVMAVLGLHPR